MFRAWVVHTNSCIGPNLFGWQPNANIPACKFIGTVGLCMIFTKGGQQHQLSFFVKFKFHVITSISSTQWVKHIGTPTMFTFDHSSVVGRLAYSTGRFVSPRLNVINSSNRTGVIAAATTCTNGFHSNGIDKSCFRHPMCTSNMGPSPICSGFHGTTTNRAQDATIHRR